MNSPTFPWCKMTIVEQKIRPKWRKQVKKMYFNSSLITSVWVRFLLALLSQQMTPPYTLWLIRAYQFIFMQEYTSHAKMPCMWFGNVCEEQPTSPNHVQAFCWPSRRSRMTKSNQHQGPCCCVSCQSYFAELELELHWLPVGLSLRKHLISKFVVFVNNEMPLWSWISALQLDINNSWK